MKNFVFSLLIFSFTNQSKSFAKNDIYPIRLMQLNGIKWAIDNLKGKIKIRFIRNEDKSDTTNRPKEIFGKLKNAINMLLEISDHPPFKTEIIREQAKKISFLFVSFVLSF